MYEDYNFFKIYPTLESGTTFLICVVNLIINVKTLRHAMTSNLYINRRTNICTDRK